jgi:glycine hydroxymethyltransferase
MSYLSAIDPEINRLAQAETARQQAGITLIPSENHTSPAVLEALATTLSDKYAEGYPGKRYYSGNAVVDQVETLVQERAKALFHVPHVNVQPYSGSPANLAVYLATCDMGDTIMGLHLPDGGHLTHGWKFSATAKFWNSVPYHLRPDGTFDFDEIRSLAQAHKPKLIWCGATAMPRRIPFAEFARIADEVGAFLVADISHIAGLVVGGAHESPAEHAHLITTTTHKTLRGPRGAMIMVTAKGLQKDPDLATKVDKAIIPGLQGGPHMNTIAGIGVALQEATLPAFQTYAHRIVENAQTLSQALLQRGFTLVSGGTDNHLILVDLTSTGIGRGKYLATALEACNLYTNMNAVPGDQSSPLLPSGLRLGTPAATTRGMGAPEMEKIADWMKRVADLIADIQLPTEKEKREVVMQELRERLQTNPAFTQIQQEVSDLCARFPIPGV